MFFKCVKDGGGEVPGQDRAWEKGWVEEGAGLGIEGWVRGAQRVSCLLRLLPLPPPPGLELKLPSQIPV